MPYEHIYGVPLLDDIHNYFPALLYDHSRFTTLTHVFHYIRSQMSTRFNLYSHGAQQYHQQTNPFSFPSSQEQIRRSTVTPTVFASFGMPRTPMEETSFFGSPQSDTESLLAANLLLSLIGGNVLSPRQGSSLRTPTQSPLTPVIVRPSAQVIQTNTELLNGSQTPPNSTCSVCQDSIVNTDSCRKLIACGHIYHRSCIDQWFDRSVFCPTCRHDIRISTLQPTQQGQQGQQAPSPQNPSE